MFRTALVLASLFVASPVLADAHRAAQGMTQARQSALTPDRVLELLLEGNERFAAGTTLRRDLVEQVAATAGGQHPMASILGCIDSRVPPELVFDQGVGDVFVARVAGNFVDPEILGSLEFASKVAGSKLVLVLGHTECGAVKGACDGVELGNLTATLAQLGAAVAAVRESGASEPHSSANPEFVKAVTHENVRATVEEIRSESAVLRELEESGRIRIVGAIYDVASGRVSLIDDAGSAGSGR